MDYEKKYNEALKWMRELYPGLHGATKEDAEHFFPELRESEDERIRKRAIAILKQQRDYWSYDGSMDKCPPLTQRQDLVDAVNAALSYLEKQKGQKPNYCHHEVDETGWTEEYRKAYYDGWNNCNMQHEQLKADQKPAEWSEEDETIIEGACNALEIHGHTKLASMLKSLRPSWKPSEEQIQAIKYIVSSIPPNYLKEQKYTIGLVCEVISNLEKL